MAGKIVKPTEAAAIDACMVVLTPESGGDAIGVTSDTEVATEVQMETTEANKLIIKGVLKGQKPEKKTITGVKVTLTDNLTLLEVAKAVQGGTITRDATGKITKYVPPLIGSEEKPEKYTLDVYTANMDASGDTLSYEKITYKHCTGEPVAFSSKDDEWRTAQYVLTSHPKNGEAPYEVNIVDELPTVEEAAPPAN